MRFWAREFHHRLLKQVSKFGAGEVIVGEVTYGDVS